MDLMWILYWIDVLGGVSKHAGGVAAAFILLGGLAVAFLYDCLLNEKKPIKGVLLPYTSISIVLLLIAVFAPSKSTMYQMLAVKGLTDLSENEKVQELGGKSLEVLEKAMDDYLKDDEG